MERDTIQTALEYAGLTTYQADAYLTLLEMGQSPAIEVGRNCSVPVSQIYDVLRSLEEAGHVETMEQEKLYVRPREPDELLEDLTDRGELLQDAAEDIETRYQQPARMDYRISVATHMETAVKQATELIDEAETFVEVSASADRLASMREALEAARERGVIVRAGVYVDGATDSKEEFDPEGAVSELRAITIPGPFLVVIDRNRTFFAPEGRFDDSYGVLIRDRFLPLIFHWYFQTSQWDLYDPIYIDAPAQARYVSIEEFVRDTWPLYRDGYVLEVDIQGVETETDVERTISGTVTGMQYPGVERQNCALTLMDVATYVTVIVDTGDEFVTVGGWGAVFEDIEAHRIDLVGIDVEGEIV
ncbi:TrmB family transcriptional regulator [Natrialbaceae archaeon A-CW2]|uniref:TrmB family transcriptional regulator n=1 Tax=Natronosalvus amylolyticus TaxID=2961994 RepID=UPI0020C95E86|nr:TrmB family transcriptional regulator [Natronosalvus amylolyticus]